MDLHEIAQEITASTPDHAAQLTARLMKAIIDQQRSPQAQARFLDELSGELERMGMYLAHSLNPTPFSLLAPGDLFVTLEGKVCRKIDPVPQPEMDGEAQPPLTALILHSGAPVPIAGNSLVHRMDLES
jgi:hypothetical protein